MSSGRRRVIPTVHPSNRNKRDLLHHLLVHLHKRTKGCVVMAPLVCFKCGQNGQFMREYPKNKQGNSNGGNRAQSSSVAPPNRAASRETTSGAYG
ncbi:hypothetical protein H5410_061008 [Solanum commersonii]|uniref:CCHC-type domain-containing protein n=1 Tax=Solanum commersonii TaxID=4109 RepID=A0A9J5W6S8_SOLCO|nr:hypothetical protein H5410_061008 [Solanum commersonii]